MPACTHCGGFGKVTGIHPSTGKLAQLSCECQTTDTPGRVPHTHQIHYPPEVIQALQQAGNAQRQALQMQTGN